MSSKKPVFALVSLVFVLVFGTFGYHLVEGMLLFDAFYMTLITISTVGFAEISPLTPAGRIITVFIIVFGIGIGTYSIGLIVRVFIEGELANYFGRRKVKKQVSDLHDHFIVCGFGRIGRTICRELAEDHVPFIVIEQEHAVIEEIESLKHLFVEMDATTEEALMQAGIMKAKGLVSAVNSDANNVFITMTAKGLRPDIFVLARASEEKNEGKLMQAGATRVVSPYLLGGKRMAQMLKRPTVVDFVDIAMMGSHLGLMMEEACVGAGSGLVGKNLINSNLTKDYGVIIVAIKKMSGEMIFNPLPAETFEAGDVIVVLGKKEDLERMEQVM